MDSRLYFIRSVKRRLYSHPENQKALLGSTEHDLNHQTESGTGCVAGRTSDTDLHKLFVIYLNPSISVGVGTVTEINLVGNEAQKRGGGR